MELLLQPLVFKVRGDIIKCPKWITNYELFYLRCPYYHIHCTKNMVHFYGLVFTSISIDMA